MKTTVRNIEAELIYKGTKSSDWGASTNQHHTLVVKTENGKTFFDFWMSKSQPRVEKEDDVKSALSCVLRDGQASCNSLEDFLSEFGYTPLEGKPIYRACEKTMKKLFKIGIDEDMICEIMNEELSEL